MKWFKSKPKTKNVIEFSQLIQSEGKLLSKKEKESVKGGIKNRERIWLGCGGTIPQ